MDDRKQAQEDRHSGETQGRDAEEIEREAEKSREALDAVPEPGTDPLHEGP